MLFYATCFSHKHLRSVSCNISYMHVCIRYNMERAESNARKYPHGVGRTLLLVAVVLTCGIAWAQTEQPGLIPLPSAEQVIQRTQDPYLGSIPQGKASTETIELTIEDALDRGLKYNLGLYLSDRATDQARAAHLRSLSDLLPNINGSF